jgi:hypothetical protein
LESLVFSGVLFGALIEVPLLSYAVLVKVELLGISLVARLCYFRLFQVFKTWKSLVFSGVLVGGVDKSSTFILRCASKSGTSSYLVGGVLLKFSIGE